MELSAEQAANLIPRQVAGLPPPAITPYPLDENRLRLSSLAYQGVAWEHDLLIVNPESRDMRHGVILDITGDDAGEADLDLARGMAVRAGLPVAVLFQIPNQPIGGRVEDDLIAATFAEFMQTGDPSLPLLVPMVGAAVQACRALEAQWEVSKIVVTGASKRGWTTWLLGTLGLPSVFGIAPRCFDHLNFEVQLEKQRRDWGGLSHLFVDYESRDLPDQATLERGRILQAIVDPYHRRQHLTGPVLLVTGGNDPFWTVDAHAVYVPEIPGSVSQVVVPNSGHGLEDHDFWMPALGAFARAAIDGVPFPASEGIELVTWSATSTNRNFVESVWSQEPPSPSPSQYVATFEAWRHEGPTPYWLTSSVSVQAG